MDRQAASATRLTPVEALMWRLEGDRNLSSNFGSVTFLDREPQPEVLRERLVLALGAIPRFRQRIDTSGPPTTGACWVDVEPDLDHHLRWVEAPGDGTEHDVLDLAAELVASPFDPDRPPWNFVVVTGLADGRAALVQRMHHAVTDGEGGIGLAAHFVDLERHPDPAPAIEEEQAGGTGPRAAGTPIDEVSDDDRDDKHDDEGGGLWPAPEWLDRLAGTTVERAGGLARATAGAVRWTAAGVVDPGRFGRLGAEVLETAQSLRRQLVVIDRARSPLWRQHSSRHRVVVGSVPFTLARTAATEAGVSINDVFITATLRGVAAYHRLKESTVHELRVAVPVSTRPGRGTASAPAGSGTDGKGPGGNSFSPTRVTLPSGEAHTAAAHLMIVSELMDRTKTERATNLVEPLAAVAELVPTPVLRATMARQAATIDYAASNVRTTPVPLYIGGAKMEATYALGPLMSTAANITMLSYDGRLDLGIHVDTAAVTDPELLRDTVIAAFHEVCAAGAP